MAFRLRVPLFVFLAVTCPVTTVRSQFRGYAQRAPRKYYQRHLVTNRAMWYHGYMIEKHPEPSTILKAAKGASLEALEAAQRGRAAEMARKYPIVTCGQGTKDVLTTFVAECSLSTVNAV